MSQQRVPDLRRLLALVLDGEPSREPARALSLALEHRLPVELTAAALRLDADPRWSAAVAQERARAAVRTATREVVDAALGPLRPHVAVEGLPWRPALGTDLDLLVPPRLFAEVRDRLTAAGLVEIGRHAGPGRAGLARIGDDGDVDLVDVETVPEEACPTALPRRDLHTGPHQGSDEGQCADLGTMPAGGVGPAEAEAYAGLRPEVARDRLCRAVAARGTVRLRDLADAEALDLFSFPRPGSPAGAGWELLRAGVGRGPGTTAGAGGLRRVAARAGTAVRVPGALLRGRPVRIRCAEPSAAVDLATDLRAVAVEVVLLDQPGRGSYVRTVLRAAVDDAVVVGGHLVPAPTVVVPAGASRPEALRQVLARLNQAGFSRPRSS